MAFLKKHKLTLIWSTLIFIGTLLFDHYVYPNLVYFKSSIITYQDCVDYRNHWQASGILPFNRIDNRGNVIHENKLQCFVFDGNQLRSLLNLNVVDKPDEVVFYLGFQQHQGADILRLIAIGSKANRLLKPKNPGDYGIADRSSIYDHADPIPPGSYH